MANPRRQWGHVTQSVRAEILRLLQTDAPYAAIQKKTHVSTTTISKIAREEGLQPTTALVSAGQRTRLMLARRQATAAPAIARTGDPDIDRYREERERRASQPRPITHELAAAKHEFDAHLVAQQRAGKGGRPQGARIRTEAGETVAKPEPTLRQRILYGIDMHCLLRAGENQHARL